MEGPYVPPPTVPLSITNKLKLGDVQGAITPFILTYLIFWFQLTAGLLDDAGFPSFFSFFTHICPWRRTASIINAPTSLALPSSLLPFHDSRSRSRPDLLRFPEEFPSLEDVGLVPRLLIYEMVVPRSPSFKTDPSFPSPLSWVHPSWRFFFFLSVVGTACAMTFFFFHGDDRPWDAESRPSLLCEPVPPLSCISRVRTLNLSDDGKFPT